MKVEIYFSTFDLFHAEYVKMLEEAKRRCDYPCIIKRRELRSITTEEVTDSHLVDLEIKVSL